MADSKKKEQPPLRSLLGGYDPIDTNLLSQFSSPNLMPTPSVITIDSMPKTKTKKNAKYDPRMSVPPGGLYTTGFLGGASPPEEDTIDQTESIPTVVKTETKKPVAKLRKEEVKPKDVKKISKQVTQAIVEKKAAEDPSWFERNKKGLRDAGIILAGGLQSLGEGIKGGNQSAANEQIYQNLDASAKSDEMELLEDPNSEQSKQAQALFSQLYGNRVKMPENLTAAQFSKQSPVFDKILQRKLMEMKANAPKSPKANPNMKEMSQVNTYRENLNRNLDKLSKLTQKYGTFELTGSAEQERQQLINDIAIAKMKMQDPTSIVSSKEADQVADALGVQGFFKSNDAALNSIKAFRDEVNSAADTKLRGLVGMEEDQEALQWAQQNPYDPDAQKILSMYGVK